MSIESLFYSEETAADLARRHKAGERPACPDCGSRLVFKPSSDETRSENWFVSCSNILRCGKKQGVTLGVLPPRRFR